MVHEIWCETDRQMDEQTDSAFWVPEFGCPNQYTSLPNSLDMSLEQKQIHCQNIVMEQVSPRHPA